MALNAQTLASLITAKLQQGGFATTGEHAQANTMAKAVAEAVVEHVTGQAEVPVSSGSSAGIYKVK